MTQADYLHACSIMNNIDEVEKLMDYLETVPLSPECYNAIKDMLEYEKKDMIERFKMIGEPITKYYGENDDRDDLEVHC